MSRIVAVDYGTKRVGLAVTDPLKIIATALETVHSKDVIQFLKTYDAEEGIEKFVVGMPSKLDGTATNATPHVQAFINLLKKSFPGYEIVTHDERFTSKMALDAMIQGGTSKKYRQDKANVDKVSAVIILQSYLEQIQ